MSITIQQAPSTLMPAYNDINWILSSTNYTQPNFKYVVDIYVASVKVDRMLVPPHPTHGTGLANIAPLIESRVSKVISMADNSIEYCSEMYLEYVVKFGEAYGSTGTTVYADLATATGKCIWNGVYDFEDYINYASGDIVANVTTPVRFLTNKPSSGDIMIDDNAWLYWCDYNLQTSYVEVKTYNSAGTLLGTWNIDNKFTTYKFLRIPSGANNLNDILNTQFTLGTQPVITGSEAYYTVQAFKGALFPLTEAYRYNIVTNCSRYTKYRFQFLNKKGGYDFFDFSLVSKRTADIERSNYKKNLGSYASANSFTYSANNRANSQFYTRVKDKFTVQSDWVREDVMEWLEELITSPDVYYDDGTSLIPVNISNPSFERKLEVNEKLFNLQLDYTLSYDRYRQRL